VTPRVQVQLQSGHFDVADRLFHHMGDLWKGSTQSMGDVKELIPEFYYLEDMFVNGSCLPLGRRQNGETVSDVVRFPAICFACSVPLFDSGVKVLPSWAGGDARKFVRIMRDALEGMSQSFLFTCSEFVFVRM